LWEQRLEVRAERMSPVRGNLMCAVCGESGAKTVMIVVRREVAEKDLCDVHLREVLRGARVQMHAAAPLSLDDRKAPHLRSRRDLK
jgi:hypothetical protein